MQIAIVGAGKVGQALGQGWREAGHAVRYAVRQTSGGRAAELRQQGYGIMPVTDAAAGVDVLTLAVPWAAVPDAIAALGSVSGKVLIDATNPLTADLQLALGFTDSAGETVARLASGARVVKAFNTTGAANMAAARSFPAKPMMPIAGDDAEAKAVVRRLAEDLGFEGVDVGPLSMSRHLEPMAMVWIRLAYAQGLGPAFAFALLRRDGP